ncbi:hypothetical protein [uncultured Clostridium sp.]|uniref:hypothetical protein n=1 Tax=uncultured Clostridium sp. TaxID=59620 RepID=UPI00272D8315|nr:hypothetical protein [uncultured Clostridium sp.]
MNRRIKKKKAKPIISVCKEIKHWNGYLLWDQDIIYFRDVLSGKENIYDYNDVWYLLHKLRKDLYLIVKKALKDSFPIQEYLLHNTNCEDNLTIYTFYNKREYTNAKEEQTMIDGDYVFIKVTGIDFVVEHNIPKAIPYKYDETLCKMFPCDNCFYAVYKEYI